MKNKVIITLATLFVLFVPQIANAQWVGAKIKASCPSIESQNCNTNTLFSEGVVVLTMDARSKEYNEDPAAQVLAVYLLGEDKKYIELPFEKRNSTELLVSMSKLSSRKTYSLYYTLQDQTPPAYIIIRQNLPVATAEAGTGSGQTGSGGANPGGQNPTGGGTTGTGGGKQVASGGGKIRDGLEAIKGEFNTTGDIAGATSIGGLIVGVIRFLLALLLALAVLMIIIGGFIYLTSAGNEDKAKNGRKTVMYAIYGLIIVILSYMLVNVVERAISTGNPDE